MKESTKYASIAITMSIIVVSIGSLIVKGFIKKDECNQDLECYMEEWQGNHDRLAKEAMELEVKIVESELKGAKKKGEWYAINGMHNDSEIIHSKSLEARVPELQNRLEYLKSKIVPVVKAEGLTSAYKLIIDGDNVLAVRVESLSNSDYKGRNESEINKLTTDMQWRARVFMNRLEAVGIKDVVITDSLRSDAQQRELYAIGRTTQTNRRKVTNISNCDPENGSKHCIGEAIDIVQFIDGKPNYSQTPYEEIAKHAEGLNFTWGGNWKSVDKPHFQLDLPVIEPLDPLAVKINNYIANYDYRADHENLDNSGAYWVEMQNKYNRKADVAVCMSVSDTGLGRSLKTKFNYANVGNNDRGDTKEFQSVEEGIEAIFIALNNDNLKNHETVCDMNYGCSGKTPTYASGCDDGVCTDNWSDNVSSCLRKLHGNNSINKNYNIKL